MLLVTCSNPSCRAQLFVSKGRQPICGRCNHPIADDTMRMAAVARPSAGPSIFKRLRSALFGRPRLRLDSSSSKAVRTSSEFAALRKQVDGLVKRAWPENRIGTVIIDPSSIASSLSFDKFVSELLKHARHTTELSTPWRTPRIFVEKTKHDVGGKFVVDEGWVAIIVGQKFFGSTAAARAILCHEVCHYILDMVDIRDRSNEENERLTDVAMFVFGFGAIFRAGYRKAPQQNREGHRVGYLSDAEYDFVEQYVASLIQQAAS